MASLPLFRLPKKGWRIGREGGVAAIRTRICMTRICEIHSNINTNNARGMLAQTHSANITRIALCVCVCVCVPNVRVIANSMNCLHFFALVGLGPAPSCWPCCSLEFLSILFFFFLFVLQRCFAADFIYNSCAKLN